MRRSIKVAPSNSLLFVSDVGGGRVPKITRGKRLWSTSSCIAFGVLMFMDGETDVTLGSAGEVGPSGRLAFDGYLKTPNRSVAVSTVERKAILSAIVPGEDTRVRIWTNHETEPDIVIIGLG